MASEVKQAVIMVGGKGTRLLPLTENKPKPILPVLDKPCLRYLIESLVEAGVKEVILACGYRSDKLVEAIGDGSDLGIKIDYSYEDEPLGTGGAIKLIEDKLDDTFIAANGDVFADISVKEEIEKHISTQAKVTIALTSAKNPCEFGIVRLDDDERILEFKEKPKPEEVFSDLVNAGVYVLEKSILADIPKGSFFDFSKDLIPILMRKGDRIQGYLLKGIWRDVGRPSDLLGANLIMATKLYDDFEWGGKRFEAATIKKPFYLGADGFVDNSEVAASVILKNSKIKDSKIVNSLIMTGCDVSGAKIECSILGDGCKVMANSHIVNSVLGDGTVVESGKSMIDNKVV
ncbi:MAG: NDP-sugar synthase [Candidatus Methanomethylophilaceae archaeon]|nr:NDP-sugar synthase [Candidatus Methanomethylophilaceae archaeon]MDY0224386.1 NDP-sugar synthase [Candidatus Methanomethylophilaceae archaeon]